MAAGYCCADGENGHHIDDPSEDALFDLVDELNNRDNTFIVIQPDEDDPIWFAPVAVLKEGGYEVVLRDSTRREHEVTTDNDLITWLDARNFPGQPTRRSSAFHNGAQPAGSGVRCRHA